MYKANSNGLYGRTMKPFPIKDAPANLDLPEFPHYNPGKYGGNPGFAPGLATGFANGGLVQQVEQNIYKKSKKFQK